MKKTQVSIEYMSVIAIVMLLVLSVFAFFSLKTINSIKQDEAAEAISSLSRAVDFVSSMGPGSETYVTVKIPGGVEYTSVGGTELLLRLRIYGGSADIFSTTKAQVIGFIPIEKGLHKVRVVHLLSGFILIGDLCEMPPDFFKFYEKLGPASYQQKHPFPAPPTSSTAYIRIPLDAVQEYDFSSVWFSVRQK